MITEDEYADMYDKCSKIRKLLVVSITTAKKKDYEYNASNKII